MTLMIYQTYTITIGMNEKDSTCLGQFPNVSLNVISSVFLKRSYILGASVQEKFFFSARPLVSMPARFEICAPGLRKT